MQTSAPYMRPGRAYPPPSRFAKASVALEVLLGVGALGGVMGFAITVVALAWLAEVGLPALHR